MISEVDQTFDLVLIMDRWFESMIFLKEALNLTFEDVVTFNINSVYTRDIVDLDKTKLPYFKDLVYKANAADAQLYVFFKEKFEQKLKDYGIDKMNEQVKILKDLTDKHSSDCFYNENSVTAEQKERMARGDFQIEVSSYVGWVPDGVEAKDFLPNPNLYYATDEIGKQKYRDCKLKMIPELKFAELLKHQSGYLLKKTGPLGNHNSRWYKKFLRDDGKVPAECQISACD